MSLLPVSDTAPEPTSRPVLSSSLTALSLSALGIVFGDIGTSPLYTLKTVLAMAGGSPDRVMILGSLSLIVWTLIIVTSIKYVSFAMRVDNDGEGGILALMSLLGVQFKRRPFVLALGLMGAALIYGDGSITPAISVLSAVEGLNILEPSLQHYILPISVFILLALFLFQPRGTASIGKMFGPVMLVWFATIALLGIWGIVRHPAVLVALNPLYGLRFLLGNEGAGFAVLGGVFLCVTGAEALYADMGHFGAKPIRLAWSALVLPSLLLNYAGQASLVLDGAPTTDNIFYRLCPPGMLAPLVILSTVATVIASQSIITGAFSMTRQAIRLGWLPRLQITQTSQEGYGQIYVGAVNWLLMIVTLGLTVGFGKSDNLASAYGIAVSATMLATSVLLYVAMREIWRWPLWKAGFVALIFITVDGAFFTANLSKIADGGYVPILLAGAVYAVMLIWHKGAQAVTARLLKTMIPIPTLIAQMEKDKTARVPGTAVFLTRTKEDAPPVMVWHVKQNRALHEHVFILTVQTHSVPWVKNSDRLTIREVSPGIWRGAAQYGYMEQINIPALLQRARSKGCTLDLKDVTYYIGHESIVSRRDEKALPAWVRGIFSFLERNALHVSEYLRLPPDSVVEIGRQVAI